MSLLQKVSTTCAYAICFGRQVLLCRGASPTFLAAMQSGEESPSAWAFDRAGLLVQVL